MTQPRPRDFLDRTLWPALALLAATLVLFEATHPDLWVQDHFYDFTAKRWIVDGNEPVGRFFFYNAPKILVFIIAAALLALAFGPARWRDRLRFGRRELFLAILTLATVPALAGAGKAYTNIFCPSEIRRYNGDVPYIRLCESYPADDTPTRTGRCFPAGHASGGFALLGLAWLRGRSRRWQLGAIALGLGVGLWMAVYQMLKGAHYLSHTTTTLLLAWIIALLWRRILRCEGAVCGRA